MKFEVIRSLKNKVFSTALVRVEDDDMNCVLTETQLQDDFGPVSVDVGGKFEAYIKRDEESGKLGFELSPEDKTDAVLFKFSLNSNKVNLVNNVELRFASDSNNESPRKDALDQIISPLEISEIKCEIFEAVMKDRITKAVETWKKQTTTFETEEVDAFEIHLC